MTEQTQAPAVPDHAEYMKHYEFLQEKGAYGGSPIDVGRAVEMWCFINAQLNAGSSVIDCSCGRGFLLQMLRQVGFQVEGTEASDWELENCLKPRNIPARKLFYSELHTLPSKHWDVVVSNDVLEHLFTEAAVDAALAELSRMARRWLLVSVGLNHAARSLEGKFVFLHHVIKPPAWWLERVGRVADVRKHYRYHNSYFLFGEPKAPLSPPPQAP